MCAATVYFVWQERNARIFKDSKRNADMLVQKIKNEVKFNLMSLCVKETKAVHSVEEKWCVKLQKVCRV